MLVLAQSSPPELVVDIFPHVAWKIHHMSRDIRVKSCPKLFSKSRLSIIIHHTSITHPSHHIPTTHLYKAMPVLTRSMTLTSNARKSQSKSLHVKEQVRRVIYGELD